MDEKMWEAHRFFKDRLEGAEPPDSSFLERYGVERVGRDRMMMLDMMRPGEFVVFRDWLGGGYYVMDRSVLLKHLVLDVQ